jgi:hypothetical protein
MLQARDLPGDHERARHQLEEALAGYREVGMQQAAEEPAPHP